MRCFLTTASARRGYSWVAGMVFSGLFPFVLTIVTSVENPLVASFMTSFFEAMLLTCIMPVAERSFPNDYMFAIPAVMLQFEAGQGFLVRARRRAASYPGTVA